MQKITTFLMFEGSAEAAMKFYVSLFDDSRIGEIVRHGAQHGDKAGQVETATFTLAGQTFMCIDSTVRHAFGFTPSMSLFVECRSNESRLAANLPPRHAGVRRDGDRKGRAKLVSA